MSKIGKKLLKLPTRAYTPSRGTSRNSRCGRFGHEPNTKPPGAWVPALWLATPSTQPGGEFVWVKQVFLATLSAIVLVKSPKFRIRNPRRRMEDAAIVDEILQRVHGQPV